MRKRLIAAFGGGALLAGLAVGGVAVAHTDGGTQYTGCIGIYGIVFQVAEGDTPLAPCGEATEISWNQEGPPGAIGTEGPQGPPGPPGPAGPGWSGTLIPLSSSGPAVVSETLDFSYDAVDTTACRYLTVYLQTIDAQSGSFWPLVQFDRVLPNGDFFGQLGSASRDGFSPTTAHFSLPGFSAPSGGADPQLWPGPSTIVRFAAGSNSSGVEGVIDSAYLYCYPH